MATMTPPAPEELLAELADGTKVAFRVLRPGDRETIKRGFGELSDESRYRRFFQRIDRLSEKQLSYLTEIDYEDHFAWIAHLPDEGGRGVGVARWVRAKDEPTVAEAAVTVIDPFHNKGIGSTLLRLATVSAVERGIRFFRAWTLGGNQPMIEILMNLGAQPGRWEQGVQEIMVPLPETVSGVGESPAPLILKAVADGRLHGEASPGEIARMRFIPHPSPE